MSQSGNQAGTDRGQRFEDSKPAISAANVDICVHVSAQFLGAPSDMITVTSSACGASMDAPRLYVEEASCGSVPMKWCVSRLVLFLRWSHFHTRPLMPVYRRGAFSDQRQRCRTGPEETMHGNVCIKFWHAEAVLCGVIPARRWRTRPC